MGGVRVPENHMLIDESGWWGVVVVHLLIFKLSIVLELYNAETFPDNLSPGCCMNRDLSKVSSLSYHLGKSLQVLRIFVHTKTIHITLQFFCNCLHTCMLGHLLRFSHVSQIVINLTTHTQ